MSVYYLEKSRIKEEFENAAEPVKIVGYDGVVLGYFTPAKTETVESLALDGQPRLSRDDIERRLASGEGRSIDEILADLEKRS